MECEGCPPDFMALPPPPPPPPLPDLCHYQGDCAHHPVISLASASGAPDIMHVVSLAAVTSLTIILVFTVSCVIVYRCDITIWFRCRLPNSIFMREALADYVTASAGTRMK